MSLRLRVGPLLLLLLIGACSSHDDADPEVALRQFYNAMNSGDYAAAVALYSSEARQVLDDPAVAGNAGFGDWARAETRQGQVQRIEILSKKSENDAADLRYQVFYADGSSKTASVTLERESGAWKLGLIR